MANLELGVHALTECLRLPERDLGRLFSLSFLAQTPEPLLRSRLEYLVREFGPAEEIRIGERLSERAARIHVRFGRGYVADGEMAVSGDEPVRIEWLRFDLPSRESDSWRAIEEDVRALPGTSSFDVRNLTAGATLAAVNRELPLGVGSVSKLAILLALMEEIAAGRRRWDEVLAFDECDRSLPTGILQDWPNGAPLTVHTAATLAIAISDNTAADLLLRELGRERVEAALERVPFVEPAANRPFFSTRGLFALVASAERRQAWAVADERGRRSLLADAEAQPLTDLAQVSGAWPEGWDWMWSAADVTALLDRLRTQLVECEVGRSILAVNKGLGLGQWPYWGFKGGSSAGRMAFAVLVRQERGDWFGIGLASNAAPESLRPETIVQLIKRAADQLRG